MQFRALIVDSLRDALDRKIFWVLVVITLIIVAAMVSVGFESDRVSLFFGMWEAKSHHYNPFSGLGRSHIVGLVIYMLLDVFLGTIGVLLMIIATAGMFPRLIESGAIDALLSKPMSRPRLFLYKYLASMVFVLLQASLFVVLTFLVMGLRWGVWVPAYLLSIPLLVLLFSYVYCVSVLVAVKTRSTVAAILLSLGAWVLFASPTGVLQMFETFPSLKEHERVHQAVRVMSWILPKTADVPYLAAQWAQAGTSIDVFPSSLMDTGSSADREQIDRAREVEERELQKSPVYSIGSSLLFEAAVVLWAMGIFARKDY